MIIHLYIEIAISILVLVYFNAIISTAITDTLRKEYPESKFVDYRYKDMLTITKIIIYDMDRKTYRRFILNNVLGWKGLFWLGLFTILLFLIIILAQGGYLLFAELIYNPMEVEKAISPLNRLSNWWYIIPCFTSLLSTVIVTTISYISQISAKAEKIRHDLRFTEITQLEKYI